MSRIFTSYFGQVKKLRERGVVPISIARYSRYYKGERMLEMAPRANMLKLEESEFTPLFSELLAQLDAKTVLADLQARVGDADCALVCHEKTGKFCHRQLVAAWFKSELGLEIEEYDFNKPARAASDMDQLEIPL